MKQVRQSPSKNEGSSLPTIESQPTSQPPAPQPQAEPATPPKNQVTKAQSAEPLLPQPQPRPKVPQLPTTIPAQPKITEPRLPQPQPPISSATSSQPPFTQPQVTETPADSPSTSWEFKTVRAKTDIFQKPAILDRLCQEEAKGGWAFVEKLDDRRARFKRAVVPDSLEKQQTANLDSNIASGGRNRLFWGLAFLFATVLPAYLAYRLVASSLAPPKPLPSFDPQPTPVPSSVSSP